MTDNILKLWMPVTKDVSGNFIGILSDTSIDRDEEFITKELLQDWAKNEVLPALANHENQMEKFVGGWKNIRTITKNDHTALVAEPFFFSKEANPLAARIKKQVEEAVENGLNPGISIAAIPKEHIEKDIDGETRVGYTKAELVEATWVPIQSNRNASYGHIAKQFGLTKPKKVEECVRALMNDPDFKPQKGRTKEESAWAVCQAKFGKECPLSVEDGVSKIKKELEGSKMEKEFTQKDLDDAIAKVKKDAAQEVAEAVASKEEAEKKAEEAEAKAQEAEKAKEEAEAKAEEAEATKEEAEKALRELKEKAVNLPGKESNTANVKPEPTIDNMVKVYVGGK
jgi:FKBP-type peptidyl-prolyl cis-trans isomerase